MRKREQISFYRLLFTFLRRILSSPGILQRKAFFFFCVISFCFCSIAAHADEHPAFSTANQAYTHGDFAGAITSYEQIASSGYESPELYFNLGNAYYKTGNIPAAILNYERAKRLAPSDEDIAINLRLAQLKIIDRVEPAPKLFYEEWWASFRTIFSVDGWSTTMIVLLWMSLFAAMGMIALRSVRLRKLLFSVGIFLFFCSILSYICASQQYNFLYTTDAIVFAQSAYVKSSPDEKGTDLFILHEGTKVELLDTVSEWKKIKLQNGNVGWLKQETVREI